jgi:hypothetical protein
MVRESSARFIRSPSPMTLSTLPSSGITCPRSHRNSTGSIQDHLITDHCLLDGPEDGQPHMRQPCSHLIRIIFVLRYEIGMEMQKRLESLSPAIRNCFFGSRMDLESMTPSLTQGHLEAVVINAGINNVFGHGPVSYSAMIWSL